MNTKSEVLNALTTTNKTGIVPAINEVKKGLTDLPKITVSKNEPKDSDGKNGDVWFIYEEPAGGS